MLVGLLIEITAGLIYLLGLWNFGSIPDRTTFVAGLIIVQSIGLDGAAIYWTLFGLFRGVSSGQLDERERIIPNQGIHRSAWNGLLFGLIGGSICLLICILSFVFALLFGTVSFFIFTLIMRIGVSTNTSGSALSEPGSIDISPFLPALAPILIFISASCLIIGLQTGWLACFRHYLLRLLLWFNGSISWNYTQFLDYAAERLLLRKAGGGYIFMHRLLLDHLASLDTSLLKERASAAPARKLAPSNFSFTPAFQQYRSNNCKKRASICIEMIFLLALIWGISFVGETQQQTYNVATAATAAVYHATAQVEATAQADAFTQANATATAQTNVNATAEATTDALHIAYPPPQNVLPILDDPLQNNSKGYYWKIDNHGVDSCKFINLSYDIKAIHGEQCFARDTDFTNFIYEVQMKIVKGDGGGIAFRANFVSNNEVEQKYYSFMISPNGSYTIFDEFGLDTFGPTPLAYGSSSAICRGLNQVNLIAAVVHGTIIELYVNHKRVAVVGSSSYIHGEIGMVISPETEAIFQNARVWTL